MTRSSSCFSEPLCHIHASTLHACEDDFAIYAAAQQKCVEDGIVCLFMPISLSMPTLAGHRQKGGTASVVS